MVTLTALLGDYPNTLALKKGLVTSPRVALDFAAVKAPSAAFKRVVRNLEFDVAELALVTYLIAKAYERPLVLLPAVMFSRFQHPYLVYHAERGAVAPADLAGRRIGIRSYSVTTVAWLRGILANDYGLDIDRVRWVTFEEPHVAEFRDPPTVERAREGQDMVAMLLAGELDAAIVATLPTDPRFKTVIPNPQAAADDWRRRNQALQINHMVVVKASLTKSDPDLVREVWRLLAASRNAAQWPDGAGADSVPYGVEANRRNLAVAIEYVYQQRLIPRRLEVDELFDDVTRSLA